MVMMMMVVMMMMMMLMVVVVVVVVGSGQHILRLHGLASTWQAVSILYFWRFLYIYKYHEIVLTSCVIPANVFQTNPKDRFKIWVPSGNQTCN